MVDNNLRIFFIRLNLIFALCLWSQANMAQAQSKLNLFLQNVLPPDTNEAKGILVLNLNVYNVTNLYAVDVRLRYDPAQLGVRDLITTQEGIQIMPGPFARDKQNRFTGTNSVDPETGDIRFAFTLLSPAPPIEGDDILANIEFDVLGEGPYEVKVVKAEFALLVDDDLAFASPYQVESYVLTKVDLEILLPPTPVSEVTPTVTSDNPVEILIPSWVWPLTTSLVILILMILFLLPRLRQASLLQTNSHTYVSQMPRQSFTSARSPDMFLRQGQRAMAQGDYDNAYQYFSEAIRLDPANPEAWLGKGLVSQQDTEKRICLERVLALDPNNEAAKAELGQ